MQALGEQLKSSISRSSEDKVEQLCGDVVSGTEACKEDLTHELWGWEKQLDLNMVMSGLVCEQTDFVMALQVRLQKIQQLL